jgi:hypothetical protein
MNNNKMFARSSLSIRSCRDNDYREDLLRILIPRAMAVPGNGTYILLVDE